MATTKPFDTNNQTALEQIKAEDLNAIGTAAEASLYESIGRMLGFGAPVGITPAQGSMATLGGLAVSPFAAMQLNVSAGLAYHFAFGSSPSRTSPAYLPADVQIDVPAADPALPRIDVVVVDPALYYAETELRQVKLVAGGPYVGQNVNKRLRRVLRAGTYAQYLTGDADLFVQTGTPAAGPVAPVPAAPGVVIAEIAVGAAVVVINAGDITDLRQPAILDATIPKLRLTVLGTDAGAFAFPASILANSLVERGGARLTNMARAGAGDYTLTFTGIGLGRSHQVTLRSSLAEFIVVDGAVAATTCQVRTFNNAGVAADRDFDIVIESNGLAGALD